jgi:casein kinase I family protein HRR25
MKLVTSSWPTIVQNAGFDDTNEEDDGDDDGIGPDWDGYISFTSWLLQDGVPEQDLFGDENKMIEGKVDVIANPPAPPGDKSMSAVKEIMIM